MAVRQVKKELELPPAHLYLEDVESLVEAMKEAAKRDHEVDYVPTVRFTLGKNRECDSIEDLLTVGGKWRNFEVKVRDINLRFTIYDTYLFENNKALFNHALQLTMRRARPLAGLLRRHSILAYQLWLCTLCILIAVTAHIKSLFISIISLLLVSLVALVWAFTTHTIVELRYSHEPNPRWAALKAQGGKVAWLVFAAIIGSAITLIGQWVWKHYVGQ